MESASHEELHELCSGIKIANNSPLLRSIHGAREHSTALTIPCTPDPGQPHSCVVNPHSTLLHHILRTPIVVYPAELSYSGGVVTGTYAADRP